MCTTVHTFIRLSIFPGPAPEADLPKRQRKAPNRKVKQEVDPG